MGNMSYCRFENTLGNLEECVEGLRDFEDLSQREQRHALRLLRLMQELVNDYMDEGQPLEYLKVKTSDDE